MPSVKPVGGKIQIEVERLDEGLDTTAGPNQVSPYGSPDCLNVVFDQFGSVATRAACSYLNTSVIETGSNAIDGMASYNGSMIAWAGGCMYRLSGTTWVTIANAQQSFTTGANVASVVYQNVLFCSDGTTGPWRYEDSSDFYKMGIATPSAPTGACNVATAAGGGPEPGTYYYKVSYLTTHVVEGQAGSASVAVTLTNTSVANVTSIPTGAASMGINTRYIYRASATGGTYRYVGQLANNTASTFTDTVGATTWAVGATPISDASSPTPFTTIREHKDRLFFDDSSNRSILRYTNFRNPYISEAANFINLSKGDGSNITAIAVQDDLITAMKADSIWVVELVSPGDDGTWNWYKTPGNIGIVGAKAFVEIQNAILFMGQRQGRISGFHILSGLELTETRDSRLRSDRISNRIETSILALPRSYWSNVAMATYDNIVYAAFTPTGQTTNQKLFWLDSARISDSGEVGSWSLWDGRATKVNNFVIHSGTLYAGSSQADGYVLALEQSGYTDAGSAAINSYFWTKAMGGEGSVESWVKDFRFANIWFYRLGSYMMKVNYRVDEDVSDGSYFNIDLTPGGSLYGTGVYGVATYGGGAADKEEQKSFGALLGRRIQLKFSNNNTAGQGFKVHGFKILANLRRQVRAAA